MITMTMIVVKLENSIITSTSSNIHETNNAKMQIGNNSNNVGNYYSKCCNSKVKGAVVTMNRENNDASEGKYLRMKTKTYAKICVQFILESLSQHK